MTRTAFARYAGGIAPRATVAWVKKSRPPLHPVLLAEAALLSTVLRISLNTRGLKSSTQLAERLSRIPFRSSKHQQRWDPIEAIPLAVNRVGADHALRFSCLRRSLTNWVMLNRRGYLVDLRIGVAGKEKATFSSHAWVEFKGRPLGQFLDVSEFRVLPIDTFIAMQGKNQTKRRNQAKREQR